MFIQSLAQLKTIVIIKFWISLVCFLFINVQPIYHLDYNKNNTLIIETCDFQKGSLMKIEQPLSLT